MKKRKLSISYKLKAVILAIVFSSKSIASMACDACKKQQPKALQGITHGSGPESGWDYLIVALMVLVTLYVLIATVKCMFKPAEKSEQHIKRLILNDEWL